MSADTSTDKAPQATGKLEQTNPDYDPNIVIETQNLTKIYRDFWGRQKVRALNALDLEVRKGEIFGLLGPNGSGKSTTIKLLLGLLFPTSGRALVFGQNSTEVTKNERIGYLPEESYLYKFLVIFPKNPTCTNFSPPRKHWIFTVVCSTCQPKFEKKELPN